MSGWRLVAIGCGALALAGGCRRSPPTTPDLGTATAPPPLRIVVDEKPLTFPRVYATRGEGRATTLYFATKPLDCRPIVDGWVSLWDAPLRLTLSPVLEAPGDAPWRVVEASYDRVVWSPDEKQRPATSVSASPREIRVHFEHAPEAIATHRILVDGTVAPTFCDPDAASVPDAPQRQLEVAIAGRRVAIRSASIAPREHGGFRVLLRSIPSDCSRDDVRLDEEAELHLDLDGRKRLQRIWIAGWWFPIDRGYFDSGDGLSVRVGAIRGDQPVAIDFAGATSLRGIALSMSGSASARRCPR